MNSLCRAGVMCFMVISSMVSVGWAADPVIPHHQSGGSAGVPATVTKVEKDAVTVSPNSMAGAEIRIVRPDDGTFTVGDRVLLAKDRLEKMKEETGAVAAPEMNSGEPTAGESVEKAVTGSLPDQADQTEK